MAYLNMAVTGLFGVMVGTAAVNFKDMLAPSQEKLIATYRAATGDTSDPKNLDILCTPGSYAHKEALIRNHETKRGANFKAHFGEWVPLGRSQW